MSNDTTTPPKDSLLLHLKNNARDIAAFLVIGLGFSSISGLMDYVSERFVDNQFFHLVLPNIANYVQGFSKFIGASLCASGVFMVLWPTVNAFGNNSFKEGFESLSIQQKFFTYVGLICVALLAASHCFA